MKRPGPSVRFTVVIPTRERCDVLAKALQTVSAQDYDSLEIIVSDNFSTDATREVVAAANDPRVRYLNTGERLCMTRNWEFALSHVDGGWVSVMGDDDGLLPNALSGVAALIDATGTRAIRSDTCYFAWPSLSSSSYGRLRVPIRSGYEVRNARRWVEKVILGQASYTNLPMLYTGGFIDYSLLRQLRDSTGAIFRSRIPDVYSAIALGSILDSYVFSREPFTVNGASKHSIGTSTFGVSRAAAGSAAQKFGAEANLPFHADVPLTPEGALPTSLHALVYESFLQSQDLRGDSVITDHARQLAIILADPISNGTARDWGRQFARLHGLDFDAIDRRSAAWRYADRFRKLWDRFLAGISNYSSDWGPGLIMDVYDASIAAAAIRKLSPSRVRNLVRGLNLIRRRRP
jgi:hypothetical protein